METALYLDTARMGTLCPAARQACQAFLELLASEGCSPAFETFLREGFEAWPASLCARFAGLSTWNGLGGFMKTLRQLTSAPASLDVFLTNRTSHLLRLAARVLFRRCKTVLITDLE